MNINLSNQLESLKGLLRHSPLLSRKNIIGVVLLVFIIGSIVIIAGRQKEVSEEVLVKNPVNCPVWNPLDRGEQIFNVFTDNPKNPQIKQIIFNPSDVEIGETQTIIVKVLNPNADTITDANTASVVYHTDNKSTTVSLSMKRVDNVSGSVDIDPNGEDLLTTWQGTWVNNDTICENYVASVTASNIFDKSTVDVTFR